MEKEFIPYEQALALKELGFDIPCIKYYWTDGTVNRTYEIPIDHNKKDIVISAPLYQQAFRWFREKYDLRSWIESNHGILKFEYVIATTNSNFIDKQFDDFSSFKTYEEAELECLKKLIEITRK